MTETLTRRDFFGRAGTATAAAWAGCASTTEPAAPRPNVLLILGDQLRSMSVGYMGDELAETPVLDRLAAEGVNFTQAVSTMPVCAAFRASLMTGKYPTSTGMAVNELRMNPGQRCLGHVVTEAGYETGFIGKWHLYGKKLEDPEARHCIPAGPHRLGWDGEWFAYDFHHRYYEAFGCGDEGFRKVDGFETDLQREMACDFIRRKAGGDKPFFLTLSTGLPHDPWTVENTPPEWYARYRDTVFPHPANFSNDPDPYMDRYADQVRNLDDDEFQLRLRCYYAMTANLDWQIGEVLKALEETGAAENTIVLFTSDHGEMHGSHGRVQKLTFYEEAARTPMLVRWPVGIPANTKSDALMGTVDILPTLLGLMGLEDRIPDSVEGDDLSGIARGEGGAGPAAQHLQGLGHTHLWINGAEWRAVRDDRFTYAIYRRDGRELLFDHRDDPQQLRDLITDPKFGEEAHRLRLLMAAKREVLQDSFETCTWYRDHWTDGNRNIIASARGPFPTPGSDGNA